MNEQQPQQVGRIVSQASNSSRVGLELRLYAVRSRFSKAGRLDSAAMTVAVAAEVHRAASQLLTEMVSRAAAVSRTPAAFEGIASGMRRWLRACEDDLKTAARTARHLRLQDGPTAMLEITAREIEKIREEIEQRLEVEQYDFRAAPVVDGNAPPLARLRAGGRPPAEFWDDMWAAIAAALYDGSLQPKTQADIERAMANWITANGHDAAESTVKSRARRLAAKLDL